MYYHFLFVHIPKTAGTSFRKAAEDYFSKENTFYDYGESSAETSLAVLKHIYEERDMYRLFQYFETKDRLVLSGHFHVTKYMSLFNTLNVITFVRHLVDQVLSHYQHHMNHLGYKDDLLAFVKDKRFKNLQSRLLQGKPLELFGFVGLTERYNESIDLINHYYGLSLKKLTENITQRKTLHRETLDDEICAFIEQENAEDMVLYQKAQAIFDERMACHLQGKAYVHKLVQEHNERILRGCAFSRNVQVPVEVAICQEEQTIAKIRAASPRPGLVAHGLPRRGFIGFEYHIEQEQDFKTLRVCT